MNWKWVLPPTGLILLLLALCQACPKIDYSGMAHVETGGFKMGCAECLEREKPVHSVELSGFWIDQHEITTGRFVEFLNYGLTNGWVSLIENVGADGSTYFQAEINGNRALYLKSSTHPWSHISFTDGVFIAVEGEGNLPVTVSWYGAQAFCESTGKRLPTEAEWEYAAKGGHQSRYRAGAVDYYRYSGSDDPDNVAWHRNNSAWAPHPVGELTPNELGTFDLSGNLREWVNDWYDPNYYTNSPQADPQGPTDPVYLESGQLGGKVMRGGSWHEWQALDPAEYNYDAVACRVTKREYG